VLARGAHHESERAACEHAYTDQQRAATRRMRATVGCASRSGGAALSASSYGSLEVVACRRALSASTTATYAPPTPVDCASEMLT
jgi:hypothetical protein